MEGTSTSSAFLPLNQNFTISQCLSPEKFLRFNMTYRSRSSHQTCLEFEERRYWNLDTFGQNESEAELTSSGSSSSSSCLLILGVFRQ